MPEYLNRHPWRSGAILGVAVGLLVGAFMMYVAWEHNTHGEIHSEAGIHWGHWLSVGLGGFVPTAAAVSVAASATLSVVIRILGRRSV